MTEILAGDPSVAVTRLANGLTVASEAIPGVKTATVGIWVAAGSRHEHEDEHGLSHLIEHMAFKGTQRRSARQIAEDIENVGGEINAATSTEHTSYSARILGEDLGLAVDVLGDILANSVFESRELAREVNVILQEYAAVDDDPEDLVTDAFMEVAFEGQAIGRPILGRPDTIRSFDQDAIRSFMAREYVPDRMVLAAAGAVEHERLVALAEAALGAYPRREAPEPARASYTGGEARIRRKLEQANLVLGLPGVSFRDPGYFATHLFAQALGGGLTSRLWHEVRETRGLAYSVDAFHWPFTDCGLFGIGAGTSGQDLAELVEVVIATTAAATLSLGGDEVERAKAQLKVSLLDRARKPPVAASSAIGPPASRLGTCHSDRGDRSGSGGRGRCWKRCARPARATSSPATATLAAIGPIRRLPPPSRIAGIQAKALRGPTAPDHLDSAANRCPGGAARRLATPILALESSSDRPRYHSRLPP